MVDPVGGGAFHPEEAAGRRRRGLIIVGVIAAVGIPLTLVDWWSGREVQRRAEAVAVELRAAAAEVDDPAALADDELVAGWTGEEGRLDAVLGHGERRRGLVATDGGLAAAYEVTYWLETRCVQLRLTRDEARVEVEDSTTCAPPAAR